MAENASFSARTCFRQGELRVRTPAIGDENKSPSPAYRQGYLHRPVGTRRIRRSGLGFSACRLADRIGSSRAWAETLVGGSVSREQLEPQGSWREFVRRFPTMPMSGSTAPSSVFRIADSQRVGEQCRTVNTLTHTGSPTSCVPGYFYWHEWFNPRAVRFAGSMTLTQPSAAMAARLTT